MTWFLLPVYDLRVADRVQSEQNADTASTHKQIRFDFPNAAASSNPWGLEIAQHTGRMIADKTEFSTMTGAKSPDGNKRQFLPSPSHLAGEVSSLSFLRC